MTLTLLSATGFTHVSKAQDIFSSPSPTAAKDNGSIPYTTSAAFLADTRNGKIPEQVKDHSDDPASALLNKPFGRSILAIIHKEYSVGRWYDEGDGTAQQCGQVLQYLTDYEMNKDDSRAARMFKDYSGKYFQAPPDFKLAFDNFLKAYAGTLQQYLNAKQRAKELQQAGRAARERQVNAEVQAREDAANAKAAAEKEAIDMQEKVAADALATVREARQKKLNAVLASPAYQIYLSALKIEEGEKLINKAKAALDYDNNVTANSGVSDLALRRSAGEEMEAGKKIVGDEFPNYKKLGGTATTPDGVRSGSDPAADYR